MAEHIKQIETREGALFLTQFTGPEVPDCGDRRCLLLGDDLKLTQHEACAVADAINDWLLSVGWPRR